MKTGSINSGTEQDQNNANFRGNDVASLIQYILMYTVNINFYIHTQYLYAVKYEWMNRII